MADSRHVTISYNSSSDDSPIYITGDFNDWQPKAMMRLGPNLFEHIVVVPAETEVVRYKFRIGDNHWVHDGTVAAEPDGYGGYNNRLDLPVLVSAPERESSPSDDEMAHTVVLSSPNLRAVQDYQLSSPQRDSLHAFLNREKAFPDDEVDESDEEFVSADEYEFVSLCSNDDIVSQSDFSVSESSGLGHSVEAY
ncbi:hypothetical protein LTS18_005449 [Coniosporium uncinatum]|uniref:Uncharacterized protein n=1 Tax=Coniosporium uncinatum TaxID=93489 RepID=A0ACC3DB70_9PEZI|nr:hypothetical protein LTS18_005449 [Coniosporium uncinatum]